MIGLQFVYIGARYKRLQLVGQLKRWYVPKNLKTIAMFPHISKTLKIGDFVSENTDINHENSSHVETVTLLTRTEETQ